MPINLFNSRKRDAVVELESVKPSFRVRWVDDGGRQISPVRLLKASRERELGALLDQAGSLEALSQLLIETDLEIDMERYGRYLRETSRVYVAPDGNIVHQVEETEVIRNPDGSERDRRLRRREPQNIATEAPLVWTGKVIKKEEAARRFVFSCMKQIVHVNGLSYDFLFSIAKELEEMDGLLLVGAGSKGNQPLILQRGGKPYRGFLEGRTRGESYCLTLLLSNMELKRPAPSSSENSDGAIRP